MKSNIIKSISAVMLFTLISKLLGLIRELLVAYVFGASNISDAYVIGTMISLIVYTGLANALFSAYIPIASKINEENKEMTNKLTSNTINCILVVVFILSILLTYNSSFIINLLSGNANIETKEIAEVFFKLTTIPSSFLILSYVLMGYMQINSKFIANLIFSVPMNFCIIIGVLLGKNNYKLFAIMYAMSLILPALIMYIYSKIKLKYRYYFFINFKDKDTNEIYSIFYPIFVGSILGQLGELIDRMFAVSLNEGIVSSMKYGKLLETTIVSIVAISIGQVIFPKISTISNGENSYQELNKYTSKVLMFMTIIIVPITILVIIYSKVIVKGVLMHGAFDNNALIITSSSLMIYSLSIPAVCFSEIIFRVFYALKKSKVPTIVFSSCMALNILLDYLSVKVFNFGYRGLALTTTFVEILSMAICMFFLTKIIGRLNINKFSVFKICTTALFLCIFYIISNSILINNLNFNEIISFLLMALLGTILYIIILLVLRLDEALMFKNLLKEGSNK